MYLVTSYYKNYNLKSLKKKLYFLGNWCLRDFELIKKFKNTILDFPWNNKKLKTSDLKLIENEYKISINKLSKILNLLHQEDNSVRYWEIIVGPWLLEFISIVFLKNLELSNLNLKKIKFHIGENILQEQKVFNMKQFWEQRYSDLFYYNLTLRIIKIKRINIKLIKNNIKVPDIKYKESPPSYKDKVIALLQKNNLIEKSNKIFFQSSYIPRIWQFFIKIRFLEFFNFSLKEPVLFLTKVNINRDAIKKMYTKNDSFFQKILSDLLPIYIPVVYLENYKSVKEYYKNIRPNTKVIYSANDFLVNDYFKIWASLKIQEGAKYILADHGGGFRLRDSQYYFFSKRVSDKFNKYDNTHYFDRNNFFAPFTKVFNHKISQYQNNILIITKERKWYSPRVAHEEMGYEIFETYKYIKNFCLILKKKKFNNFIIRPKLNNQGITLPLYNKEFRKYISSNYSSENNIFRDIKKTKIVLCTYMATTFSECILSDIPVIVLYPKDLFKYRENYNKIFKQMIKYNLIFFDPEKCANFILKNYETINKTWWNTDEVIKLRNRLKLIFSNKKSVIEIVNQFKKFT
jgi:putative transferase (TIGR04331 family)